MRCLAILLICWCVRPILSAEYFIAPNGADTNSGTKSEPFASFQKAQSAASPGDTVWIRGGTYVADETHIAKKQRIWAYVNYVDKSGSRDKPIRYFAYENERPIFDFSHVAPK